MEGKDYYTILEVTPSATLEQVKQAYRRLVRLYHPDLNKEKTDLRMKQLNEAYEVLSDTARRAAYDAQRLESARNAAVLEAMRRLREEGRERLTWKEGMTGFVRELKKELDSEQPSKKSAPKKMTWAEGLSGFTREFKKGLRDG